MEAGAGGAIWANVAGALLHNKAASNSNLPLCMAYSGAREVHVLGHELHWVSVTLTSDY